MDPDRRSIMPQPQQQPVGSYQTVSHSGSGGLGGSGGDAGAMMHPRAASAPGGVHPLISPSDHSVHVGHPSHHHQNGRLGGGGHNPRDEEGGEAPPVDGPTWAQPMKAMPTSSSGGIQSRESRSLLLAQAAAVNNAGVNKGSPTVRPANAPPPPPPSFSPAASPPQQQQQQPAGSPSRVSSQSKPSAPIGGGIVVPSATATAAEEEEVPPILRVGDVLRNWVITNRIGGGAFGETYTAVSTQAEPGKGGAHAGKDDRTSNQEVCVKVERNDKRMVLRLEVLALKKVQSCQSVVRYVSSGRQDDVNFLVMEKLGENLSELRRLTPNGAFELYTVLHIGVCCLQAIQGIHELGLVHRDIKPSNFVIGNTPETRRRVYLIDFGLAKRFRSSNGELKPGRENAGFRGTSRYASLNSHNHKELGRVDDLWSLLFMLVEFITGTLPWRRAKEKEVIAELKVAHVGPQLVSKLPREFTPFVQELMKLEYESEPNYELLIDALHRCRIRREYPEFKNLDWEVGNTSLPATPGGLSAYTSREANCLPEAAGVQMPPDAPLPVDSPQKFGTAEAMMIAAGMDPLGVGEESTPQLGPPEKKRSRKGGKHDKRDKLGREKKKTSSGNLGGSGGDAAESPKGADPYPGQLLQGMGFETPAGLGTSDGATPQRQHNPLPSQSHQGTFVDQMGPPITSPPEQEVGLFKQVSTHIQSPGYGHRHHGGHEQQQSPVDVHASILSRSGVITLPLAATSSGAAPSDEQLNRVGPLSPELALGGGGAAAEAMRVSGEMSDVVLNTPTQSQGDFLNGQISRSNSGAGVYPDEGGFQALRIGGGGVGVLGGDQLPSPPSPHQPTQHQGFTTIQSQNIEATGSQGEGEVSVGQQQARHHLQQGGEYYNGGSVPSIPELRDIQTVGGGGSIEQEGAASVPNTLLRPHGQDDYSNAEGAPSPRGTEEDYDGPPPGMMIDQFDQSGSTAPRSVNLRLQGGGGAQGNRNAATTTTVLLMSPGDAGGEHGGEGEGGYADHEMVESPGQPPRTPVERSVDPEGGVGGMGPGLAAPVGAGEASYDEGDQVSGGSGARTVASSGGKDSKGEDGGGGGAHHNADGFSELADAEADAIPSIGDSPQSKRVVKEDSGCGCCVAM